MVIILFKIGLRCLQHPSLHHKAVPTFSLCLRCLPDVVAVLALIIELEVCKAHWTTIEGEWSKGTKKAQCNHTSIGPPAGCLLAHVAGSHIFLSIVNHHYRFGQLSSASGTANEALPSFVADRVNCQNKASKGICPQTSHKKPFRNPEKNLPGNV